MREMIMEMQKCKTTRATEIRISDPAPESGSRREAAGHMAGLSAK